MPENENPKLYQGAAMDPPAEIFPCAEAYAELDVTTNFSFLHGASHPDELVYMAALLGYRAIAITDINTLAGVVRAYEAARKIKGFQLLVGARLVFADGTPDLLVWPTDREAYARLSTLLTVGRRRALKGECHLTLDDFLNHQEGMLAALTLDDFTPHSTFPIPHSLVDALGDRLSLAIHLAHGDDDQSTLLRALELGKQSRIPLVATNRVHYHDPGRRRLQDILTCTRHGCTIQEAGRRLFANAERYLKPPPLMHRLFQLAPQAIERTVEIASRCTFSLDQLRYSYPCEIVPPGKMPTQYLREETYLGAARRYPNGVSDKVRALIEKELSFIQKVQYESYFLTVYDLVQYARKQGILCQGRGSAANSAVCYCLGVTSVDPENFQLVFERFASEARSEPPDIDIDFEHERREEVIQYVYEKYGRDRAAMTGSLITYRGRSAVRDVGKALGLSTDTIDELARKLDWWDRGTVPRERLIESGINPDDPTIAALMDLTTQILGFPRHLSQHVGGMIISQRPLSEIVPIENASMDARTVIQWDKDDLDAVGLFKIDLLALGMMTAISRALEFINAEFEPRMDADERRLEENDASCVAQDFDELSRVASGPCDSSYRNENTGETPVPPGKQNPSSEFHQRSSASLCGQLTLATIPWADTATYDMISDGDTVGVFQIESRAQMSMLPRLRPREFYDLVIEVAIVRPGPIQGDMVHPYLQRREAKRNDPNYRIEFPKEELRDVLEKTLGVPLFQEQAMRLAIVAAGFTGAEADGLRKAMAAWKRAQGLAKYHDKFVNGMTSRGYEIDFAERCFKQIAGFGEYGFPESHAASFALLVYASAWLKRHHPAAFCAALLNSQPMGFYAPAQLVRDAREHGVEVRPVEVNASNWDCTLESTAKGRTSPSAANVDGANSGTADQGVRPPGHAIDGRKKDWGKSGPALRLGFRQIKGMREEFARQIMLARQSGGTFATIDEFHQRTGLPVHAVQLLAEADAFGSLDLSRRPAAWVALGLSDQEMPLVEDLFSLPQQANLPVMSEPEEVRTDYHTVGLSLRNHPLHFVRDKLMQIGVIQAEDLLDPQKCPHGKRVKVAGLVLVRQRPGTASGVVFITLEDETGIANLILWANTYERYRPVARYATLLEVTGYVQRQGQIVHVLARHLRDLSDLLTIHRIKSRDFH